MASAAFPRRLVVWFRRNRRPMPWRLAPSPYACWLSEIMMQQTTSAAVLPYSERFLKRFPTVGALAARYGLVIVIAWIGALKFTNYEAKGIEPLVANSPLMSWIYNIFSVTAFSAIRRGNTLN